MRASRKEMKRRGRRSLKGHYLLFVAACLLAALLASSDFDTGFAKNVLAGRGDRSRGVGVVARGADWGGGGGVGGHGNLPGAGFQMLLHWTPECFE